MLRNWYILVCWCLCLGLQAQSISTEFGKNRVQYHDDFANWWQYETQNFVVYWYGKGRNIAQPVIQMAELYHDEIQKVIEHRINDKIEIIVYVDVSDLKQSNIGTEETFTNKTGETKIVGNKMFVYFDGNHQHLEQKIREGIATVYLNNMLFGSSLQEIIQNAVLLNIPDWYKQGLVAYTAFHWDVRSENQLRDLWSMRPKDNIFDKLAEESSAIVGQSFWFFIEQNYGKSTIPNLLYLAKISRGIDNSFEYIINKDISTLKQEWEDFYTNYYNAEEGKMNMPSPEKPLRIKNKKTIPVTQMRISPDGRLMAYSINDLGKVKVYIRDLETGKDKRILCYGYKNLFQETDYNYPILDWHPDAPELSILYENKDVIKLVKYSVPTNKKIDQLIPTDFQRIYAMTYVNDLDYVFSATMDGFCDLYYYKSKNRNYSNITNDFYDDLDVRYTRLGGENGYLFVSNRTSDTLENLRYDTIIPNQNFDIYFLPLNSTVVKKITSTSTINESQPFAVNEQVVYYLSDASGVNNLYSLPLNTKQSKLETNLYRHITTHHITVDGNHYGYTLTSKGDVETRVVGLDEIKTQGQYYTQVTQLTQGKDAQLIFAPETTKSETVPDVIEPGYYFQSKFPDPPNLTPIISNKGESNFHNLILNNTVSSPMKKKAVERYDPVRAITANKRFALSNIVTKMDNEILFEGLESYTGDRQQLLTTPLGILFKGTLKDLFEDYVVEGGVRIPTTFNGSEYFIFFDNKKSRVDRRIALYRKSNKYTSIENPNNNFLSKSRKTSLLGLYQIKYPFDIYRSVRATGTLRLDRFLQLSTENNSYQAPAVNEKRISLKVEYIFDNTYDAALNIKHGTRYKFFVEAINEFDIEAIDNWDFTLSKGFTSIVGFDARHYLPILDKSILALRLSGATSFGSKKMLYHIGGMENWLFPSFDTSIPVPDDESFAYKANAFQLRGFDNNIRNGGSFVVSNVELRIPFFQYILGKNRGSSFFKNMQLVPFFDAGLAWHGTSPYSKDNPLNKVVLQNPLVELEIEYFRDPLVFGYGLGLRTQFLGYFIKGDYAWGVETRKVLPAKFYLSIGLDF